MRKLSDQVETVATVLPSRIAKKIRGEAQRRGIKVSQLLREHLIHEFSPNATPVLVIGDTRIPLAELGRVKIILEEEEESGKGQ